MKWRVEQKSPSLIAVTIDGKLGGKEAVELMDEVIGKMTSATDVLFDLKKMKWIDSSGLGVLVQILQKANAAGRRVVLAELREEPKIVFDITKVNRVFEIVPHVSDAKL